MISVKEGVGGSVGNSPAISEFCEYLSRIEVMDFHYSGMRFTWSGSPHGVGVIRKLDRILARFLASKSSDHSPTILEFGGSVVLKKKSSFKFQNYLAYRTNFVDLVRQGWTRNGGGVMMYRVVQKLKHLKPIFRNVVKASGNLCAKVKDLQLSQENIQFDLYCDPFNDSLKAEEIRLTRDYKEASLEEERMLRQK
ncbi:hypothetical protein POM88_019137 [Heracleum sosnowskyi]|uniref:Uncharacterized protein n=1 Tax=Heracleum sosnowskyi TaxID=360622 RepID=A0AAD8ITN8_9APIA|nr:hypothetical protein POM88_019137 [Heracleum sosnowskyi]